MILGAKCIVICHSGDLTLSVSMCIEDISFLDTWHMTNPNDPGSKIYTNDINGVNCYVTVIKKGEVISSNPLILPNHPLHDVIPKHYSVVPLTEGQKNLPGRNIEDPAQEFSKHKHNPLYAMLQNPELYNYKAITLFPSLKNQIITLSLNNAIHNFAILRIYN